MSNNFDINEEELLRRLREAKDVEIERLLTQYGTSLKDVREMFPQLTSAIKQRQLTTTFPTQPLFFTASEATELGLSIPSGWMLKFSPTKEGDFTSSFITSEEWEISESGLYTSPTGEQYSRADIEALLAMPTGGLTQQEMPFVSAPLSIENLTKEGQTLYQEYQEAGGELDVVGWVKEREQQQLETEQVFGKVFPEQDIQETLDYIETDPGGFLTDMREIGRTAETEALLKALFPEITEEEMYQLFGRLPEVEESKWKNVLDALHLSAMQFWYQLKQGFTSLIPQYITRFFAERTAYAPGEEPEKELWATKTTGTVKPLELMSDAELLAYYGTTTEEGPELTGAIAIVRDLQKRYEENQAEMRSWLIEHPELQPPAEWEGGVIEKVKEDPTILLDPAYIAYVAAESATYTAAFIGTSLIVGAATANPFLGLMAGWALTTPAMTTDLYEDLLASGATEDQALRLAVPIGAVINSVELFGSLPALRAISPVFAKAFTQNVRRQVTQMTLRQLIKKGLRTFTDIEIAETIEEIIQQAIQNATVATIDENRSLFENIPETTVRTLIATLPLAIFGGGTHTAHLYGQFSPGQKQQIRDTIKKLTDNGVPAEQAELVAIGQILETPEGEAALARTVEEVSALPEIKRQAETVLNKIQETNPDLVVPAGGNMGLGVKAPITDPFANTPEALLTIPSDKEIIDGLIVPNWIKTTVQALARIPGVRKIEEAVFGWRVLIDKESQVTEDIVGRGAVVYGAITRIGGNASRVMTSVLRNTIADPIKYFGFNASGYSRKMANRLLPEYKSERKNAGTLEHIVIHSEMYDWTKKAWLLIMSMSGGFTG